MAWTGVVESTLKGQGMTPAQLRAWLNEDRKWPWKPSGGTLHNTAMPTLAMYQQRRKVYGRADRMINLQGYYRDIQKWPAAPHFFVDELSDGVYPFTPLWHKGIHSPGYNGTKFGCEMFGDYTKEDDDRGDGFKVKMNAVAVFGEVYAFFGLDPDNIVFHKEDEETTHKDCPGKDVEKAEFIRLVKEYMGQAGEHPIEPIPLEPKKAIDRPIELVVADSVGSEGLNLRENSTASARIISVLPKGQKVAQLKVAKNGKTDWSFVWLRNGAGNELTGWVATRYLA